MGFFPSLFLRFFQSIPEVADELLELLLFVEMNLFVLLYVVLSLCKASFKLLPDFFNRFLERSILLIKDPQALLMDGVLLLPFVYQFIPQRKNCLF